MCTSQAQIQHTGFLTHLETGFKLTGAHSCKAVIWQQSETLVHREATRDWPGGTNDNITDNYNEKNRDETLSLFKHPPVPTEERRAGPPLRRAGLSPSQGTLGRAMEHRKRTEGNADGSGTLPRCSRGLPGRRAKGRPGGPTPTPRRARRRTQPRSSPASSPSW